MIKLKVWIIKVWIMEVLLYVQSLYFWFIKITGIIKIWLEVAGGQRQVDTDGNDLPQ